MLIRGKQLSLQLKDATMSENQVLQAIKDKLHSIDPNVKAYLFGSRARGDARNDADPDKRSDWDILVLLDKPTRATWDDFDKYSYPLTKLGWNLNEDINTIVRSEKEWKDNSFSLFNHNVEADAVAL